MEYRTDTDSLGEVKIPKNALYGPQTCRSLTNFNIGSETLSHHLIRSYALLKASCANANAHLGFLPSNIAKAIISSANDIYENDCFENFPLRVWQTGSGTQTNMNLNEVIANKANLLLDSPLGSYTPVHPNDHVNFSQSTNDTFPSAMHITAGLLINNKLLPSLNGLLKTLLQKTVDFKDIIKMGRTHLQDAVPLTLGQEFSGYHHQLSQLHQSLKKALPLMYELAIGGSAVGTGLNTHKDFPSLVCKYLSEKTGLPFFPTENKFSQMAAHDNCCAISGILNTLAVALMKIANDIRWLASGPRGGIGELLIPENEPGSSIMPGKVNPTQCEALTMISCQVMGNHTGISIACSQGNFELNVFKPVIIKNLVESIEILSDGISSFDHHCAQGIKPNTDRIDDLKSKSLMLVTCLTPKIGYEKAAAIAKKAHQENKTLKEVCCVDMKIMSPEEFDNLLNPKKMVSPNLF